MENKIVGEPIVHPEYSKESRSQHHDIALLRLARKVDWNEFRKPICIVLDSSQNEMNYTGYSFDLAGELNCDYFLELLYIYGSRMGSNGN